VLDSEGLAKAVLRAREVTQWLALARADDLRVITSAATVVEVAHPRLNRPALEWTLSRVVVEPVTEPIARRATAILAEAGLHGHRHAAPARRSGTGARSRRSCRRRWVAGSSWTPRPARPSR
jgi:hypothetical protein